MRRGVAFKAAADEVIGDNILWQDTMAKVLHEAPDKPAKKRPWEPEKPRKGGKGGKGTKGRQSEAAADSGKQRQWHQDDWGKQWQPRQYRQGWANKEGQGADKSGAHKE